MLHYATAFAPGAVALQGAKASWLESRLIYPTPLFLPLNGYGAVDLFFLMSGVVLTLSFRRRPFAVATWLLRRTIRLGLPMAAAILSGLALLSLWPYAHVAAGALTGSSLWLGAVSPRTPALPAALHQIACEGMFFGYAETSLLPNWVTSLMGVATLGQSYDAPLWTLHIEFLGSVLVMALVAIRALLPEGLHLTVAACFGAVLITSPLLMFVLGHLVCPLLRNGRWSRAWLIPGLGSLLIGLLLASGRPYGFLNLLFLQLPQFPTGPATDAAHFQWRLAEIFILTGVMMLPRVQAFLTRPTMRWLGRISFSLYLVHFPILFTLTSALFLNLYHLLPYDLDALVCTGFGCSLALLAAVLFDGIIDGPAIAASRALNPGLEIDRTAAAGAPE